MDYKEHNKKIEIRNLFLILFAMIGIGVTIYYAYQEGFFNEPITTKSLILAEGDTLRLDRSGYAIDEELEFESDDETVIDVDGDGEVTALSVGKANVTLKSEKTYNTIFEIEVKSEEDSVEVTKVTLSKNKIKMKKGDKYTLNYEIEPKTATNKNITWYSTNESVVIVENGKITAKRKGEATIVVRTGNNKVAKTEVVVTDDSKVKEDVDVKGIDLNTNEVYLYVDGTANVVATIIPNDATNKNITWTSQNKNIATVSNNGIITGKKVGTTTVMVKTDNNKKASVKVNVINRPDIKKGNKKVEVKSIDLNLQNANIYVDDKISMAATVYPSSATNKRVTWSSSDSNVAKVDNNGMITGLATGTATITAKSNNGKTAKVTITVIKKLGGVVKETKNVEEESIELNVNEGNVYVGDKLTLSATIYPSNASNKTVTWTSSNSSVATVDKNGLVEGQSSGTVTITAKSNNGKTAIANITVIKKSEPKPEVSKISFKNSQEEVTVGDKLQLGVTYEPTNAVLGTMTWTSTDSNIATVSATGLVTPKKAGTVTITAKTNNGKTANIKVVVKEKVVLPPEVSKISFKNSQEEVTVGDTLQLGVTYEPTNAVLGTVTWTSEDSNIASVSTTGLVQGKKAGIATITAKTNNGKTANIKVLVKEKEVLPPEVSKISFKNSQEEVTIGNTLQLGVTYEPTNAVLGTVTWTSTDSNIATVSNLGVITPKKAGTVTITTKTSNGKTASVKVRVYDKTIEVNSISLNKTSANMYVGDTLQLSSTISPSNATDKGVVWSSSNERVVKVDNSGKVIAIGKGSAVISVTTGNNKTANCTFTISEKKATVTSIVLNKTSETISNAESLTLTATVNPSNAVNKKVTWTSSNPSVATVDNNGVVKGIVAGTTTITAKAGGMTATCEIVVKKDQIHFINLGFGGNATLIESENKMILIDAGNNKDTSGTYKDFGKNRIINYFTKIKHLKNGELVTGINKLDAVIISHLHYDHARAMKDIITKYKPTKVFIKNYSKNNLDYYNDILEEARKVGSTIVNPNDNTSVTYGNFTFRFYNTKEVDLNPSSGITYSENVNSIVVMASIKRGNKTYLTYIPGDVENDGGVDTEAISKQIVRDYGISSSRPLDIYVASHHGYYDNDASSPSLAAVNNINNAIKPLHIKNAIITNTMGWFCNKSSNGKYQGILNIANNLKNNNGNTNIYFANATRVKVTFTDSKIVIDGGEVLDCSGSKCSSNSKIHSLIKEQGQKKNKCSRTPY